MASVQTEQQLWLSEGVVRTRATLNYSISRAELAQLAIDVPADQKVVNVFDANVRQWSVKPVEGRQRITAQLFEPAKTSQQVTVELEKITAEKAKDTVAAPVVKAVGVGRQQGVIVVQVAESLRAEAAKTSGLLQVDAGELPAALRPREVGVRLSLCHGSLRVGLRRREGAAADHGRFAAGGPAAARAAGLGPDGGLHDREGGRIPPRVGRSRRLRGPPGPGRGGRRRGAGGGRCPLSRRRQEDAAGGESLAQGDRPRGAWRCGSRRSCTSRNCSRRWARRPGSN